MRTLTETEKGVITNFFKHDIKRIVPWEDLKEGEIYHMPPVLYSKRFDFKIVRKTDTWAEIKKRGMAYPILIWKTDKQTHYISKLWKLGGNHE